MNETRRFSLQRWIPRTAGLAVLAGTAACATSTPEGPARLEPGVRVRVETPRMQPRELEGDVTAVDTDTISVQTSARSSTVTPIPLAEVSKAEVSRGTHGNAGRGALYGGITGTVIGLFAVFTDDSSGGWYDGTGLDVAAVVMLGLLGAGLGAAIGSAVRTEVWQEVPLESIRVGPTTSGGVSVGISLGMGP